MDDEFVVWTLMRRECSKCIACEVCVGKWVAKVVVFFTMPVRQENGGSTR